MMILFGLNVHSLFCQIKSKSRVIVHFELFLLGHKCLLHLHLFPHLHHPRQGFLLLLLFLLLLFRFLLPLLLLLLVLLLVIPFRLVIGAILGSLNCDFFRTHWRSLLLHKNGFSRHPLLLFVLRLSLLLLPPLLHLML